MTRFISANSQCRSPRMDLESASIRRVCVGRQLASVLFVDRIMHSSTQTRRPPSECKLKVCVQGPLCPHGDTGALAVLCACAKPSVRGSHPDSPPCGWTRCTDLGGSPTEPGGPGSAHAKTQFHSCSAPAEWHSPGQASFRSSLKRMS